jgi:integrase
MAESDVPFDRWHRSYPKDGDTPCRCGTKKNPLYPSADHGRGQRWQARYTDPTGRQRRFGFDSYQEARDHLDEARVAMRKRTWVDPDLGNEKVWFYAKQFIDRRRKRNSNANTTDTYESHLRVHIVPLLGHVQAKSLKRRDTVHLVEHLIDKREVGSAFYVIQIFKTWRVLVNYMVDEDVPLPANVCSRIALPTVKARVEVAFTPQEVARLAAGMREVEPRYEVLVWIAACAGLRQGEAFGLRESSVAWLEDRVYVEEQRQRGEPTELKTRASRATLPVDHFLIERLAEHLARFRGPVPVSKAAEQKRRQRGYVPPVDEGLIVTTRAGAPLTRSHFHDKWRKAVERAGMPRGTRFHDLKHFYTTHISASGVDPKTAQALSRHAEFSETMDTYAHPPVAAPGVTVNTFSRLFDGDEDAGECPDDVAEDGPGGTEDRAAG